LFYDSKEIFTQPALSQCLRPKKLFTAQPRSFSSFYRDRVLILMTLIFFHCLHFSALSFRRRISLLEKLREKEKRKQSPKSSELDTWPERQRLCAEEEL
jgi:hypothetical protein